VVQVLASDERELAAPTGSRWVSAGRWPWGTLTAAMASSVAFCAVRPADVDLWAALARASAVRHGVGLTYWFSWYGGGATPANYSVLAPWLSATVGTTLLVAFAAFAVTPLAAWLARGSAHPRLATWAATLAAACNLWSGRVPFVVGSALALAALGALRARRRWSGPPAAALLGLSTLVSPVSGAFGLLFVVGLGLVHRGLRRRASVAAAVTVVLFGLIALLFSAPGPEPWNAGDSVPTLLLLALIGLVPLPRLVRVWIGLALAAGVVVALVPNGLGSNFDRLVLFGFPPVVAGSGRLPEWLARARPLRAFGAVAGLAVALPVMVLGAESTVSDLRAASLVASAGSYYEPMQQELTKVAGLVDHRVELVDNGVRTGDTELLPAALLARGWETQVDHQLNPRLAGRRPLTAAAYRRWLDANAVGYVALPLATSQPIPEHTLVARHTPRYLKLVWSDAKWRLYRVADAAPLVSPPGTGLAWTQGSYTLRDPSGKPLRLDWRWSRYLTATGPGGVRGRLERTADGWSRLVVPRPGTYVLHGAF